MSLRSYFPWLLLGLWLLPGLAGAQVGQGIEAVTITTDEDGGETWSVTLQILVLMTLLTLLPAALIMMTAFTRILIVLAILRQGLGTSQTPSNQILIGLAFFLTLFVMAPVFEEIHEVAVEPYLAEEIGTEEALETGIQPLRGFMLEQTRESDLRMFAEINGIDGFEDPDDIPLSLLVPSFVTSELKTAFQIGFLILIPFLIIDLVVASVLMSMGMVMLSPLIISLPFKVMLFVLVDGWALLMNTLATSFFV
ncbi:MULTISPECIES: flagellar type III secretion system pore protein FliP [Thioalkalivibrio]|uniref:Flagellar biosynthetic protein FliP n=1 Tax=Thioalkalivibrio halophilus TaxID=252474 RepID=A0A1V3A1W1_9GAMM|nr:MULTISPECIES: flagellar type III secretion system pore protein FliP [Thioalkalivibrio]OOC11350.1 flagellar biosynthetic protein FliP [Thioalkalivibrio halophilus]